MNVFLTQLEQRGYVTGALHWVVKSSYLHEVHVFDVVGVIDWVVDEGDTVGGRVALALGEVGP